MWQSFTVSGLSAPLSTAANSLPARSELVSLFHKEMSIVVPRDKLPETLFYVLAVIALAAVMAAEFWEEHHQHSIF